jgi:hypothetical protein
VKKIPRCPTAARTDAALKVTSRGKAVPKGPFEVKNPYSKGSVQYKELEKAVMNAAITPCLAP